MGPFDVVTFGETMIRLSPPDHQTIEQATSLDVSIGGTESNTAIAVSRLGLKTCWVSKLVNDPLGRKIASSIRAHGVDTSGIIWTNEGRNATYFIEFGRGPRPHRVTYDRKNSAINTINSSEINWSLFKGARVAHLTGITAALGPNCRRLVSEIIKRARKERSVISFDVNHRTKLWSHRQAERALSPICSEVDILFVSSEDARNVFGTKGAPEEIVTALASRFGCSSVIVTLGKDGAICCHKGKLLRSAVVATTEVDRVGAGDAFSAGFLFGYLTQSAEYAINFASAIAALKFTIPGDLALVTKAEVEAALNAGHSKIQR
ncbi:sugar kinase [Candidatus Poribacteria bacterium]|nr:sugar kinase [Candidatus Poribacteria bacterium]